MKVHNVVINECDAKDNAFGLHEFVQRAIRDFCIDMMNELIEIREATLLKRYMELWNNFKTYTLSLNKLFAYLNRYHLKNMATKSISEECMCTFKKETWTPVKELLQQATMQAIEADRNKEEINRQAIRDIIQSYKDMGLITPTVRLEDGRIVWHGVKNYSIYVESYEQAFLEHTRRNYAQKAGQWVLEFNAIEYIN